MYHTRVTSQRLGQARRRAAAILVLAGVALSGCAREVAPPIAVSGRTLTVKNQTGEEWRSVEVWLNDHYRVTKPSMPPGERFDVPLNAFVAGFGQRFDPARNVVRGIEVTATTRTGTRVTLVWGTGRRR
ncbi:MAG: hypothetical protein NTY02_15100 [Acidobacteria bacterium]|nr:hypothetical protein [Acidobacteriota bacterium]